MIKFRSLRKAGKCYFSFLLLSVFFVSIMFLISGCENNPSDVGLSFIDPRDTLNKKVFDSGSDTVLMSSSTYLKYVNTSTSQNLFVGKYQSYESRGLIKFTNLPTGYDTFSVVSSKLRVRYNTNYFKDSLGITSFNIYKLNRYIDISTVAYDSITSSDIGTSILGAYSGTPVDTTLITIPFDNQIVSDWLKNASDTNVYKNYGLIFLPNSNSTTIKAFYSTAVITSGNLGPYLMVVVSNGTRTDTLNLNISRTAYISDAPASIIPNERILIQSGVSYNGTMRFDISKLPRNVIINEAYIQFKCDPANSFYLKNSQDKRIAFSMITDTISHSSDNLFYYANLIDSITYGVRLNAIFQKWNSGTAANYGLQLINIDYATGFNSLALYTPTASDPSKRPYLRILYTLPN